MNEKKATRAAYVSDRTWQTVKRLGEGNASKGVEVAVELALEALKSKSQEVKK